MEESPPKSLFNQSSEETLAQLNPLLRYINQLGGIEHAELYFKRLVLVVDANIVLPDIRAFAFNQIPTSLQLCLKHDVVSAYAPVSLEEEVLARLEEIEQKEQFAPELLQSIWNQHYRPYLRFVEHLPEVESELINELRDPSDKAYIQAYEKLKADGVLSSDPDLMILNITAFRSPQFVIDLRRYAEGKSVQLQVLAGGMIFGTIGIRAIIGLVKLITQFIQRFPVASMIGFGTFMLILLSPKGREKLAKLKVATQSSVKDFFATPGVQSMLEKIGDTVLVENKIEKALPAKQQSTFLKDYVCRVLAQSARPLTLDEIQKMVEELGYKSVSPQKKIYLKKVLNKLPDIKQDVYGKWRIGN